MARCTFLQFTLAYKHDVSISHQMWCLKLETIILTNVLSHNLNTCMVTLYTDLSLDVIICGILANHFSCLKL